MARTSRRAVPHRLAVLTILAAIAQGTAQEPAANRPESSFFQRLFGEDARPPQRVPTVRQRPAEPRHLYRRGELPPGSFLTETEAAALTPGNHEKTPTYLTGEFQVTAVGSNRAIMRTSDSTLKHLRVVVELSPAGPAPVEGRTILLDARNAMQIYRVTHSVEGTVTVFVKEITMP